MLGCANATRTIQAPGVELGSLLALARTRADAADADRPRKRTFLDVVVEVLCGRGERPTALRFAGPFASGDVVVAARPRARRRREAHKKPTLSDDDVSGDEEAAGFDDDDYESSSSDDSSDDDSEEDASSSPGRRRRERAERTHLVRAARWLPSCFVASGDGAVVRACAETVHARRTVHGGLHRAAPRGEPRELAAVVGALRRRVAAARAVAAADLDWEHRADREAAAAAAKRAADAEEDRKTRDRDRAAKAAAAARRFLDAFYAKERGAMAAEDASGAALRRREVWRKKRKPALVALGVLCAAARDAEAARAAEKASPKTPPKNGAQHGAANGSVNGSPALARPAEQKPRTDPENWAKERREKIERAARLRAEKADVRYVDDDDDDASSQASETRRGASQKPRVSLGPRPRRNARVPSSWRPPSRLADAVF